MAEEQDKNHFLRSLARSYQRSIGSIEGLKLLAHIGVLGAGGALAGRAAAPVLTRKFRGRIPQTEGVARRMTGLGAALGAGLGAFTGSRGLDYRSAEDLMKSLFQRDYWKKHPERLKERVSQFKDKLKNQKYKSGYSLLNTASEDEWEMSGFMPSIPVQESKEVISEDLFLDPFGKNTLNSMLDDADEDRDGLASQFDLSKAALRAGAGFVPSYLTGRVVGSLLRLPKGSKKRLSTLGGIAGAVANTGLFSQEN